jgi:hypothetical protein
MADPRETARAWLARALDTAATFCEDADEYADAILSADGVVVEGQPVYGDGPPKVTALRVVIRLPAQPVEETL